jgi:hypothetical protein
MDLGFHGEVVDFYQEFRRGYPTAVIDALVEAFELGREDIVVDIGCGTGQLTVPMADRVRAVVGMDPEPDMLERARQIANERGMTNVNWVLGPTPTYQLGAPCWATRPWGRPQSGRRCTGWRTAHCFGPLRRSSEPVAASPW